MKIINLFGGPGVGKSTIATGLFYKMKTNGLNVEYVSEYAKDLTYEDRINILESDQLYIFAKQHRRISRLEGKVDYIVTDSPLFLSNIYVEYTNNKFPCYAFKELILEIIKKYENVNFLIERNPFHKYQTQGRSQTKEESLKIDEDFKRKLKDINCHTVISENNTVELIFEYLFKEIING